MENAISDLPYSGRIKPVLTLSALIAFLTLIASTAGIFLRNVIYPSQELIKSFVANDVANLLIGLPALIGSIIAVRRGSLIGLLCLPGAWLYIFYNYLIYSLTMPIKSIYPVYPLLVILSFSVFTLFLRSLSSKSIKLYLDNSIPVKRVGGFIIGLGSLFLLRASSIIVSSLVTHSMLPKSDLAVNIADLLITPVWIIIGVLLWKRHHLGFGFGLGILFQANSLFFGLILFLILQPLFSSSPIAISDLVVIIAMALVALSPFLLFLRGIKKRKTRSL